MRRDDEHKMQVAVFEWAAHYRELDCMYAIPNGGHRDARTGARLKAEGVKAGMPDICVPIPCHNFGALYIELKTARGKTTDTQDAVHSRLRMAGNYVVICRSVETAIAQICAYTGIPNPFTGDTTK